MENMTETEAKNYLAYIQSKKSKKMTMQLLVDDIDTVFANLKRKHEELQQFTPNMITNLAFAEFCIRRGVSFKSSMSRDRKLPYFNKILDRVRQELQDKGDMI